MNLFFGCVEAEVAHVEGCCGRELFGEVGGGRAVGVVGIAFFGVAFALFVLGLCLLAGGSRHAWGRGGKRLTLLMAYEEGLSSLSTVLVILKGAMNADLLPRVMLVDVVAWYSRLNMWISSGFTLVA